MNFLNFINKHNKYKSGIQYLNEAFKNSEFKKVIELIFTLLKNKLPEYFVTKFDEPISLFINGENYKSYVFVISKDTQYKIMTLDFKVDESSSSIYSVSFYEDMYILFSGKAKAKLILSTLGTSIALILPTCINIIKTSNYNWYLKDVKKQASKIFSESYTYIENDKQYNVFISLTNKNINDMFRLTCENEANDYKWKKKQERDFAYYNRREDPETFRKLDAEYNEIVKAVDNGAQTIEDINIAINKNVSVKLDNEDVKSVETSFDEMKKDPQTAFKQMELYIKSVMNGLQPGVIICGAPGIGKTYKVLQQLKAAGYKDEDNMFIFKGKGTPRPLYIKLFEYKEKGKILVIDDADSLVGPKAPEDSINILKAALDSTSSEEGRKISYQIASDITVENGETVPKSFFYNGSVIVITNYSVGQLNKALRGRVFTQSLDFTTRQLLDLIHTLMPNIEPTKLTAESKRKAYEYLCKLEKSGSPMTISIRSFCTCAKLFELTKNEGVTDSFIEDMIKEQMANQTLEGGKSFE